MRLTLFARFAWVHDWTSPPSLNAAFQTLPGGASDGLRVRFGRRGVANRPNWTLAGKFEAELASRSQTYSGIGPLRATW